MGQRCCQSRRSQLRRVRCDGIIYFHIGSARKSNSGDGDEKRIIGIGDGKLGEDGVLEVILERCQSGNLQQSATGSIHTLDLHT